MELVERGTTLSDIKVRDLRAFFIFPKTISSQDSKNRDWLLVIQMAKVYVNGQLVVEHVGGFTPFEAEINSLVRANKNCLTVAVNNIVDETTLPMENYSEMEVPRRGKIFKNSPYFDFFNYAGIHRPVKIYTTPRTAYV